MNLSDEENAAQRARTDGRVLRGVKTRTAIVEALLDLFEQKNYSPTAKQIAAQAQVSVRSIFQHFEDMETLYQDLIAVQTLRVAPIVESLQCDGSLDMRVAALATQRSEIFEQVSPARHALALRSNVSANVGQLLEELSGVLQDQLRVQFRAELSAVNDQTAADSMVMLDLLWSFESWDRLRNQQQLSAEQATSALCAATFRILP